MRFARASPSGVRSPGGPPRGGPTLGKREGGNRHCGVVDISRKDAVQFFNSDCMLYICVTFDNELLLISHDVE